MGIYINRNGSRQLQDSERVVSGRYSDAATTRRRSNIEDVTNSILPQITIKNISIIPRTLLNDIAEHADLEGVATVVYYDVEITLKISDRSPRGYNTSEIFNIPNYSKYFKIYCLQTVGDASPTSQAIQDLCSATFSHGPTRARFAMSAVDDGAYDKIVNYYMRNLSQRITEELEDQNRHDQGFEVEFGELGGAGEEIPDTAVVAVMSETEIPFGAMMKSKSLYDSEYYDSSRDFSTNNQQDVYYKIKMPFSNYSLPTSYHDADFRKAQRESTVLGPDPSPRGRRQPIEEDQDRLGAQAAFDFELVPSDFMDEDPWSPIRTNGNFVVKNMEFQNLHHYFWIDFDVMEAYRDAGIPTSRLAFSAQLPQGGGDYDDIIYEGSDRATTQQMFFNLSSNAKKFISLENGDIVKELIGFYYQDGNPYMGPGPFRVDRSSPIPGTNLLPQSDWYEGLNWLRFDGRILNRPLVTQKVRNTIVSYIKPELWPTTTYKHNYNTLLSDLYRFKELTYNDITNRYGTAAAISTEKNLIRLKRQDEKFSPIKDTLIDGRLGPMQVSRLDGTPLDSVDFMLQLRSDPTDIIVKADHRYNIFRTTISLYDLLLQKSRYSRLWENFAKGWATEGADALYSVDDVFLAAHIISNQDRPIQDMQEIPVGSWMETLNHHLICINLYREQIEGLSLDRDPQKNADRIKRVKGTKKLLATIPGRVFERNSFYTNTEGNASEVANAGQPHQGMLMADGGSSLAIYLEKDNIPEEIEARYGVDVDRGSYGAIDDRGKFTLELYDHDTDMIDTVASYVYSIEIKMYDPMHTILKNMCSHLDSVIRECKKFSRLVSIPTYGMMDGLASNISYGLGTNYNPIEEDGSYPGSLNFTTGLYESSFATSAIAQNFNGQVSDIALTYLEAIRLLSENSDQFGVGGANWENLISLLSVNSNNSPKVLELFTRELENIKSVYERLMSLNPEKIKPLDHPTYFNDISSEIKYEKMFLAEPIKLNHSTIESYSDTFRLFKQSTLEHLSTAANNRGANMQDIARYDFTKISFDRIFEGFFTFAANQNQPFRDESGYKMKTYAKIKRYINGGLLEFLSTAMLLVLLNPLNAFERDRPDA